jgi:TonB family protein
MSSRHSPRYSVLIAAAAVLSVLWPSGVSAGSDLEQHLRDQYKGKTLLVRNFYSGSSLRYDTSGQLTGRATAGDWTVDALVEIDDLRVSGHRLSIKARRLYMGWVRDAGFSPVPAPDGKRGRDYEESRRLRIEADFGSGDETADGADAMLARIFLTSQDHFAELVPDYWKHCVRAGLAGSTAKDDAACKFSPEFLAVPGVADPSGQQPESTKEAGGEPNPYRFGKGGLTAPKVLHQTDPSFSEEARLAKYQGTVVLRLGVDKTGRARNIWISRPLGCGLDRKAVESVEGWQFKPGTRDGEPSDAEIAVEVDFHLY